MRAAETSGQSEAHATQSVAKAATRRRREIIPGHSTAWFRAQCNTCCALKIPGPEMAYAEVEPPPGLAPWVCRVWHYAVDEADPPDVPERIVPDGRCELIVHFGEPYRE